MPYEYNSYNQKVYIIDPYRWDINLCDTYYKGDKEPQGFYKVQTITVNTKIEKITKYVSAVLEAYELVRMGPKFSGAYSQYGPKNKRIINKLITQWCLIFEGRLLNG